MIYRIYPSKDTFITNYKRNNVAQTGSNAGASEILYTFRKSSVSGTSTYSSGSVARILTQFDLSSITTLTASNKAPTNGITYKLKMSDARHAKTLPSSYDLEIAQLTTDWDEGRGIDIDNYSDKGFANWDKAKSNAYWTAAGSDFTLSKVVTSHFDEGDEDLDVNVTSQVNDWLAGSTANRGFIIKMTSSIEDGDTDFYIKMFHARNTHYLGKRPCLEAQWDDSVKDDRTNFIFDNTGSLYLYNIVRGQLTNISNVGTGNNVLTVKISDASGTLATYSGSHTGIAGIYSATFALATGSYSGSKFYDTWFLNSKVYVTNSFYPQANAPSDDLEEKQYFFNVTNLKNEYESDELVRFRVFARNNNYNPAVVLTASSGPKPVIINKAYYRIDDDRTNEVIIPFGTGSVETTRLSYDKNGNYFDFYMSSLAPNNVYRILFLLVDNGQNQLVDKGFKFKVV
jgi:hypothetical protein